MVCYVICCRCNGQNPKKFGLRIDPESNYENLVEKFALVADLLPSDIVPIEINLSRGLISRYVAQEEKMQKPDGSGMLRSERCCVWMYQVPSLSRAELEDRSPSSMEAASRNDRWIMAIHRRMVSKYFEFICEYYVDFIFDCRRPMIIFTFRGQSPHR